jgi:hypothetical protein
MAAAAALAAVAGAAAASELASRGAAWGLGPSWGVVCHQGPAAAAASVGEEDRMGPWGDPSPYGGALALGAEATWGLRDRPNSSAASAAALPQAQLGPAHAWAMRAVAAAGRLQRRP